MSSFERVPHEEVECPHCGEKMIKHVIKEGARYHVPWWDNQGRHCSEPDCEINHRLVCKKRKSDVRMGRHRHPEFSHQA